MCSQDEEGFSLDFDSNSKLAFNRCADPILDPMVLRAYLASPLTNLDADGRTESKEVRAAIRTLFESYEFQGVRFEVYDPAEVTPPGTNHSDDEVYVMDHHQTSGADFVIFLLLAPSLGVGMEAQIAADCGLPRFVIAPRSTNISRMFRGLFSPTIAWIEYRNAADARSQIRNRLPDIASAAIESATGRRAQVEELCAAGIGEKILETRLIRGMALRDLAAMTDIRETWLKRLEWDPCVAAGLTMIQFHRIAHVLDTKATISEFGLPSLERSKTELKEFQDDSLKGLLELVRESSQPVDNDRVLTIWQQYMQESSIVSQDDEKVSSMAERTITVEGWRSRYARTVTEETLGSFCDDDGRKDASRSDDSPTVPASPGTESDDSKQIVAPKASWDRQRLLPGIDDSPEAANETPSGTNAIQAQSALSILGAASHGLPPFAIAAGLELSVGEIEATLGSQLKTGIVESQDGLWYLRDGGQSFPPLENAVVARCIAGLLSCFEHDLDTEFSRPVLRSVHLLSAYCEPMSPALTARMLLLEKHQRQEARSIASRQVRQTDDDSSPEYVELLLVLGRTLKDDEATSYLNEALAICQRGLEAEQGKKPGWVDLSARVRIANALARKGSNPTKASRLLSEATALFRSIGNESGAAVAELQHLLLDGRATLKRHQRERLERESPAVRVAVLREGDPAKLAVSGALSLREELSDETLERLIAQAKSL